MKNEHTIFKAMELFEMTCYRETVTSGEVGLFHALLHHWNRAGRPTVFRAWFKQVSPLSGLGTEKTAQSAKDKLIKKGVLFYFKDGTRGEPHYSFNALFNEPNPLLGKITSKRQVTGKLMESKRQVTGDSPQVKESKGKISNPLPLERGMPEEDFTDSEEHQEEDPPQKPRAKPNRKKQAQEIPNLEEVISHMLLKLPEINSEWTHNRIQKATKSRYETFLENGWKDGFNKPVKQWKTKFVNTIKNEKPWSYSDDDPSETKTKAKYSKDNPDPNLF